MRSSLFFVIMFFPFLVLAQANGGQFSSGTQTAISRGEFAVGGNPLSIHHVSVLRSHLGNSKKLDLGTVEGSTYLDNEFKKGVVFYENDSYDGFFMRYDGYNDEIEIRRNTIDDDQIQALIKDKNIWCVLNGDKFMFSNYYDKGELKSGYLTEIFQGKQASLYKSQRKVYKEARESGNSIAASFPAKFINKIEFYASTHVADNPVLFKPKLKSALALFSKEDGTEIKKYVKKNGLKLNIEKDLKMLFVFIDNLSKVQP